MKLWTLLTRWTASWKHNMRQQREGFRMGVGRLVLCSQKRKLRVCSEVEYRLEETGAAVAATMGATQRCQSFLCTQRARKPSGLSYCCRLVGHEQTLRRRSLSVYITLHAACMYRMYGSTVLPSRLRSRNAHPLAPRLISDYHLQS